MSKDNDWVVKTTRGTLFFDSHGFGPTEGDVKVRAMVTLGKPRVGLMGDAVGGWYLSLEQARTIGHALLNAAIAAEEYAGVSEDA